MVTCSNRVLQNATHHAQLKAASSSKPHHTHSEPLKSGTGQTIVSAVTGSEGKVTAGGSKTAPKQSKSKYILYSRCYMTAVMSVRTI